MKFILLSLSVMLFSASAFAEPEFIKILSSKEIRKALGQYPALGSEESAKDFAVLKNYQATRTEAQCADAAKEETTTVTTFFAGKNGPLSRAEADEIHSGLLKVYAEAGVNIYLAKKLYKRPRPYLTDAEIKPCISLEDSYAYPSGHATLARMFARVLSRLYPERSAAFMKRADEIGTNRVLGGVHHPSDIEGAKKLGDLLATELEDRELSVLFK
jgi:acid phosphatase (class A)